MITIKNLRTEQMHDAWDVRVDRASVLGNPFLMRNESERDSVCDEYAEYFDAIVTNNLSKLRNWGVTSTEREQFMTELRRLYKICKQYGRLNLYCWCAPKRCHAETIRNFLMQYIKTDEHPSEKSLECSSKGDKRFSAMYAYVKAGDYDYTTTIERFYQGCKRNKQNRICGKGAPVDHIVINGKTLPASYLTAYYRYLWYTYLKQHPELVEYASQFTNFTDMFRGKAINCQADCVKAFVQKDKDFYNCIFELIKITGLPNPAKKN